MKYFKSPFNSALFSFCYAFVCFGLLWKDELTIKDELTSKEAKAFQEALNEKIFNPINIGPLYNCWGG